MNKYGTIPMKMSLRSNEKIIKSVTGKIIIANEIFKIDKKLTKERSKQGYIK